MAQEDMLCPRCGQDRVLPVRLVHLDQCAAMCPECDALWVNQQPSRDDFEDYATYMRRHGRADPDNPSEVESFRAPQNRAIVQTIDMVVQAFRRGEASATELEESVESQIHAIEGLRQADVDLSRKMTAQLVLAVLETDHVRAMSDPAVVAELEQLRALLRELAWRRPKAA